MCKGSYKMAAFLSLPMRRTAKEEKTNVGGWGTHRNYAFISFKITLLCLILNLPSSPESFCYSVQSYRGSWGERGKKKIIESLRLSDGYSESLST